MLKSHPHSLKKEKENEATVQINKLMFKLLEVPEPANPAKLLKKDSFRKVFAQSKDILEKFTKIEGLDYFVEYFLVIFKIATAGRKDVSIKDKEFSAIIDSFDKLGMSKGFGFIDKLKLKSKIEDAIKEGDYLKTDIPAFIKKMEANREKYKFEGHPGKILIYHATIAARADGNYTEEEKKQIQLLAKELNISDEDYDNLQKLVRVQARFNEVPVSMLDIKGKMVEDTKEQELEQLFKHVFSDKPANDATVTSPVPKSI